MNPVPTVSPPELPDEFRERVQQLRLDPQLNHAKSVKSSSGGTAWLPWTLCLLLSLAWGGVALRTYRNPPPSSDFIAVGPGGGDPAAGSTATSPAGNNPSSPAPPAAPGTIQLEVKGYIISAMQVNISPIDVSGRLLELYFKEGQFIPEGQPLAKIDTTNYEFAMREADNAVAAAQERVVAAEKRLAELDPASVRPIEKQQIEAQIGEARAVKARADDERQRLESLRGSVSQRELDIAINDALAADFRLKRLELDLKLLEMGPRPERLLASQAELATARADLKGAQARQSLARWRLENCIVRAPFSGTVTQKGSEIGSLVNPAAFGNISAFICGMANLADLEVELEIPEKDIPKLTVGQSCRIRADAYPNRPYEGRLDRIMPIADRAKSIVKVRVKIQLPPNEPQGAFLKIDMGAVVSFLAPDSTPPAAVARP